MTKILSHLMLLIGLVISPVSWAQQTISITWPFSLSGAQATYLRLLIKAANEDQNDYNFILENRPGAGGSIAINHVITAKNTSLVGSSSSFFLRPIFFPNESYNIEEVKPVLVQAINTPLAVASQRYASMDELKRQTRLTIGIQNGGITQVVAQQLAKHLPNTELVLVPYNGTFDATQAMLGGHIDLSVDMLRDLQQWVNTNRARVIGITGEHDLPNMKSFRNQGISGLERVMQNWIIYTSAKTPDDEVARLNNILRKANTNAELLKFYAEDHSQPANMDIKATQQFYQSLRQFWPAVVKTK